MIICTLFKCSLELKLIFSVSKKKAASLGSSQPSRVHAGGAATATKVGYF